MSVAIATGCNRADTDENAQRASAEMRELAGRAGERIADSWLATKIQAQFFADDDVKGRDIRVSARDGVVTLRGVVDSDREREEALSIARNTDGVGQIDDQLSVAGTRGIPSAASAPAGSGLEAVGTSGANPDAAALYPTDDRSVTTNIQAKFFRDSSLKTRHIDVATQAGIVTLRGTVANDNERAQARLLAWTTNGVKRVDDVLTVDPTVGGQAQMPLTTSPPSQPGPGAQAAPTQQAAPTTEPAPATSPQDAALETAVRNRLQGAQGITVTAKDGVVLLDGTVPTTAAKQRLITTVRGTAGVIQVVDRLVIRATVR